MVYFSGLRYPLTVLFISMLQTLFSSCFRQTSSEYVLVDLCITSSMSGTFTRCPICSGWLGCPSLHGTPQFFCKPHAGTEKLLISLLLVIVLWLCPLAGCGNIGLDIWGACCRTHSRRLLKTFTSVQLPLFPPLLSLLPSPALFSLHYCHLFPLVGRSTQPQVK